MSFLQHRPCPCPCPCSFPRDKARTRTSACSSFNPASCRNQARRARYIDWPIKIQLFLSSSPISPMPISDDSITFPIQAHYVRSPFSRPAGLTGLIQVLFTTITTIAPIYHLSHSIHFHFVCQQKPGLESPRSICKSLLYLPQYARSEIPLLKVPRSMCVETPVPMSCCFAFAFAPLSLGGCRPPILISSLRPPSIQTHLVESGSPSPSIRSYR